METAEKVLYIVQICISGVIAWISDKLGILFPVLGLLLIMMILDYISGMLASRKEALEHPDDPNYGWSSKKGAAGIIKKVGYLVVIAGAMVFDYIILHTAQQIGIQAPADAFFGLLVAVWYILNELLSVIENAGRMGANIPVWLSKYIAALKNKIDDQEIEEEADHDRA